MTYPRSHMLVPGPGTYHVVSRCVRRAWLCGTDQATGRDFSHRRAWIERRIHMLARLFPVSIYSYAVMSNHYHIVLKVDPQRCASWDDEEVASRWLTLCPGRRVSGDASRIQMARKEAMLTNPQRLQEIRCRLGSLSWFMRFINEPLARLANKEDECTGRFWEGRFKSQLLLDETAMLACMVYVDLNPLRAGIASIVQECEFTSIHYRLTHLNGQPTVSSLFGEHPSPFDNMPLAEYIELLSWTAANRNPPRGETPSALANRRADPRQWFTRYLPRPGVWCRAVGSISALRAYAQTVGQQWIRGWSPLPGH